MKNIQQLLGKNKDLVIIFVLSFLLSLPHIADICSGYLNYLSFDSQEFLLWNYSAINHYIPYKDFFYPYGLLFYYRNYNLIFTLINYLFSPILFALTFFFIKKIVKRSYYLYFSMLVFYLFIITITGLDTFSRYGIFVISSLFFSYIFYSSKQIPKSTLFTVGVFLGLTMFLMPDLGSYLITFFVFISVFSEYIKAKGENRLSFKFFLELINKLKFISFGFLVGTIPLIIFLLYPGNVLFFLGYFKEVQNIVLVAKTPFFSFIDSPANIFTLSILFLSIFFICYKLLFFKDKFTLSLYFQISLIVDILILEQKSIIRSIDQQITFISLMLLVFVIYELIYLLPRSDIFKKIIYSVFLLTTVILYSFNIIHKEVNIQKISNAISLSITNKCFDNNLQLFLSKNTSYIKIINFLKKQPNFNQKVFSFPTGDSAFYVLLNQKPPYYNAIFEGSSAKDQAQTIKYIQNNNIKFITLNINSSSIQDGVSDYFRQPILFNYILKNFYPFDVVTNHLLLKRNADRDFFKSEILNGISRYKDYLLDIYLYKIPYSEGLYKYNYLEKNNKLLIESTDVNKINLFLVKKTFRSNNKIVVLVPGINYKDYNLNFIKFQTENRDYTTVHYNSCKKNKPCIINPSRLPFFYTERIIKEIRLDKEFKGNIKIFDLQNPGNLW